MAESLQKWLGRNRPPRVQITYDVETLGAIEKKELPFVVGILADLMGDRKVDTKLKDRKFVDVDRDNFPSLMDSLAPRLSYKVSDQLADGGDDLNVSLTFKSVDDFRPDRVLLQLSGYQPDDAQERIPEPPEDDEEAQAAYPKIEAIANLYEEHRYLAELLAKVDLKENLADLLRDMAGGDEEGGE